jgi:hypothetical protein
MAINIIDVLNDGAFRLSFESFGEIKVWPLSAGISQDLQKLILEKKDIAPKELVLELLLRSGTRVNVEDERKKGDPPDRSELEHIDEKDLEQFSKEYLLMHPELVFEDTAKARDLTAAQRKRQADYTRKRTETNTVFLARILRKYLDRSFAKLTKTVLDGFSNVYRDLFAQNENISNRLGQDVAKLVQEPLPPVIARNPLWRLDDISGAMADLVKINQESVLLVKSLNDLQRQSGMELAASSQRSDANADKAIKIALASIIVSVALFGIGLYVNYESSKQTERLIRRVVEQNELLINAK